MYKISSNIDWDGQGFFALKQGTQTLGQIRVQLTNGDLTLLDTNVMSTAIYFQWVFA